MHSGVSKSGSPSSRWMMEAPSRSSFWARSSTSMARNGVMPRTLSAIIVYPLFFLPSGRRVPRLGGGDHAAVAPQGGRYALTHVIRASYQEGRQKGRGGPSLHPVRSGAVPEQTGTGDAGVSSRAGTGRTFGGRKPFAARGRDLRNTQGRRAGEGRKQKSPRSARTGGRKMDADA